MRIFNNEDYYGNIEYKRYFNQKDKERKDKYTTQLNFRVNEGLGKAIYLIGVNDNGSIYGLSDTEIYINIEYLLSICNQLDFSIKLLMRCSFQDKKFLIARICSNNFKEVL
jgi:elongation factor 1-alpha